jgi:hypothetical protein
MEVLEAEKEAVSEVVAEAVKKVAVDITTEEKLALREIELAYLKGTMELKNMSDSMQKMQTALTAKSKEYQVAIDGFFSKYGLNKLEHIFNGTSLRFEPTAKK